MLVSYVFASKSTTVSGSSFPFTDVTEVYNKLKHCNPHMTVYLKEAIPNRFYYQHSDRIQPILLVADEGWTIALNTSSSKCKCLFLCLGSL